MGPVAQYYSGISLSLEYNNYTKVLSITDTDERKRNAHLGNVFWGRAITHNYRTSIT